MTLIERGDRLIAREEPFASDDVEQSLREKGVDVMLGTSADVGERGGRRGDASSSTSGGPVRADELLVAIGRRLNSDEIGVDTVGLEPGKPIEVDDAMRAKGTDWLYAIGDVNGRALLTHMGKYQARIAADVILGYPSGCVTTNRRSAPRSPRVIFTDPQVAAVGYTLDAAQQEGLNVRAVDVLDPGQRRRELLRPRRRPRHHAARGRRRPRTSSSAPRSPGRRWPSSSRRPRSPWWARCRSTRLFHAVPAFPTRSEVWLYLLEALGIAGPCGGPQRA